MADISATSVRAPFSVINPRKMTPITIVLAMLLLWVVVYATAPIEMYTSPELYPYLMLGLCFGGLVLGLTAFEPSTIPEITVDAAEQYSQVRSLYRVSYALGLTGIIFRAIDWVLFRGFSIGLDFAENLEKAAQGGGNVFASSAAFMVPFTVVPYMFYAVSRRNGWRVGSGWAAAGLAILWPMLTLMMGGRSSMFMQLGMLVIARLLIFPRFPKAAFVIVLVLFLAVVYAAGFLFIERARQFGLDMNKVARLSVFTVLMPATSEYYHISSGLSNELRAIYFINTTMAQYFTHGLPEFVYLVENYSHGEQWGSFTFISIVRILDLIAGQKFDAAAIIDLSPRLGTYTTIFGPLYIDFGPLTPIFAVGLGGLISWVRRRVLNGSVVALPLYTAMTMQILAAVAVGTINGAYGIFYDMAFVGLWVGYRSLGRPALLHIAES